MNKIKFNIKDRKMLYIMLSLVLICVFTLTIAYSALSAVLTIQGNARVSAADWDIYLNNPRVTSGSATTDVPEIKTSSTLEFSTTLNMPGDFYEFVVDVVNGGDLDAMIENVVKTPDLTTEQAKFLKYEITYQNGESINSKQILYKDTSMPIKVRIEYRKDLVASDLPTGQVVLDLALSLEYIQSDGTGSSVNNNGVMKVVNVVSGDGTQVGNEVCIGEECFYVISSTSDTVTMLSKYNLYVGGEHDRSTWTAYGEEATGKQDSNMLGYVDGQNILKGTTVFSNTSNEYSGSIVEGYVNNYNSYLITQGVTPIETRLITLDELISLGCSNNSCSKAPNWVYSTSYWTSTGCTLALAPEMEVDGIIAVSTNDSLGGLEFYDVYGEGVRPVIVISMSFI